MVTGELYFLSVLLCFNIVFIFLPLFSLHLADCSVRILADMKLVCGVKTSLLQQNCRVSLNISEANLSNVLCFIDSVNRVICMWMSEAWTNTWLHELCGHLFDVINNNLVSSVYEPTP